MPEDIDFDGLVDHVRTQSTEAPGSDTDRVRVRTFEAVTVDALGELRTALEDEDVDRGALAYFVSPANAARLVEGDEAEDDAVTALEEQLGHEVHVDDAVPDDTILFMDPAAVEGAELRDPTAVAYGTVGKAI